ncbi:putative pterin-4-alpha-carbinolamine dehydratase [Gordonia araii NBRC 100433]|uniref:Putative pterin-4-alpha-carbinolamine dehydratase n=1 Tax=Gordonia araii NBRC 100433 TaxID=1073574 RepID=G7H5R6_9ACTN|nr:4a-hydroxytetrahydrobiopterin dehydratase [Gordonia araii]NNG95901.1 4a-hydroxytetrahydrobiopterin dehydratase [Gordonia araii NBRC 100433]GAB11191.1 putative pterin-4-alpha-carbinolamine dehydratase [Gordonia araii NBRC 100433]
MTTDRYRKLTAEEAAEAVPAPWHVAEGALRAEYRTQSMVRGLNLVTEAVEAAEAANHHPDIDFRYGTVTFTVITHAVGQLTDADVELATAIARIAERLDIAND